MIFPTFSGRIPYNNKNTELFEFFRLYFGFLVISWHKPQTQGIEHIVQGIKYVQKLRAFGWTVFSSVPTVYWKSSSWQLDYKFILHIIYPSHVLLQNSAKGIPTLKY